ncbi:MAG TPA: SpoIIIAH-like family protein [Pseudoflavonifractor sp.]|nr:SpoIIIAH-like family protein [Pseudoflavonifractor sp.]
MKLWKRNAVVAAIVLFVCVAVYLNWSYHKDAGDTADAGKTLGQAALVGGNTDDPLLGGIKGDGTPTNADDPITTTGYFDAARLNRQQSRDNALSLLQQAASAQDADQAMKDEANGSIQAMANLTVSEAQIENLVTAKGYADCVAFIGDKSVSVVVAANGDEGITDADVAKISEIVTEQTGFPASQIKIIEAEP